MTVSKRITIDIRGKVQGVLFRREASREARRWGLTGFVRNEEDGSVRIEAEGPEDSLGGFIRWCRKGPTNSRIDAVETRDIALKNDDEFEIDFG